MAVQIYFAFNRPSEAIKNGVKPNFSLPTRREPHDKTLGFTWSLFDVAYIGQVWFFYDLDDFGGIRSTQPTLLVTNLWKTDPIGKK